MVAALRWNSTYSSSVSEALPSSDVSQARRNESNAKEGRREGMVRCVREDEAELELELLVRELECELENEADAAADAKDESAVGATGSGATLSSMVRQWSSVTGLILRSRSPKPSSVVAGLQDSRRELDGSGPSAMVRRPMRRSGGKPTALSLSSSSASQGCSRGRPIRAGGCGSMNGVGTGNLAWEGVSRREAALRLRKFRKFRDAAAGAKSGVSAGRARRDSNGRRRCGSVDGSRYEVEPSLSTVGPGVCLAGSSRRA